MVHHIVFFLVHHFIYTSSHSGGGQGGEDRSTSPPTFDISLYGRDGRKIRPLKDGPLNFGETDRTAIVTLCLVTACGQEPFTDDELISIEMLASRVRLVGITQFKNLNQLFSIFLSVFCMSRKVMMMVR